MANLDFIKIKPELNRLLDLSHPSQVRHWVRLEVKLINSLIFNHLGSSSMRIKVVLRFINYIIKLNRIHGTRYTIKYLKACTVSLQRYVSGTPVRSLQEIEPGYPFPRCYRGLPITIGKSDLHRIIYYNDVSIIRFWLTWFSVYRVLRCTPKPKLETITLASTVSESDNWRTFVPLFVAQLQTLTSTRFSTSDLKVSSFRSSWRSEWNSLIHCLSLNIED